MKWFSLSFNEIILQKCKDTMTILIMTLLITTILPLQLVNLQVFC